VVDYGSATTHSLLGLNGNTFFGATPSDEIFVDMQNTAALGNLTLTNFMFTGNNMYGGGTTNTYGFKLPTSVTSITGLFIGGNSFANLGTDVANWKGTYGTGSYLAKTISLPSDMTTNSTSFTNVTDGTIPLQIAIDASRSYYFNCELTVSSSSTSTGFGAAVTGPTSPTTFTYIVRIPATTVEGTLGTDNMYEQEGNADDDTPGVTTTTNVANNKYTVAVRGNLINGTNAGNLTARIKIGGSSNNITVYKGSNCMVQQMM